MSTEQYANLVTRLNFDWLEPDVSQSRLEHVSFSCGKVKPLRFDTIPRAYHTILEFLGIIAHNS
jgi:hypothetical protein